MRHVLFFITMMLAAAPAYAWVPLAQMAQAGDYQQSSTGRFTISADDITEKVEQSLKKENMGDLVEALLSTGKDAPVFQAKTPLTVKLHALSLSPEREAWQAQAYMLSEGKTLAVLPVSGRYRSMVRVPVLVHAMDSKEIIEPSDIKTITMPERQLRKDTVLDEKSVIGLSPRNQISAGRPMRLTEVSKPRLITKKAAVEMIYTSNFINIRSVGEALENGAEGDVIRVKNIDSQRAISARVIGPNKVEVNMANTL